MKIKSILVLLVLSFFFGACSRLDVAVRVADRVALKAISRHFDLNSTEEAEVRKDFQSIFKEVKKEEFLKVANLFESFADQVHVEKPVEPSQIQTFLSSMGQIFLTALQRFQPLGEKLIEIQAAKDFTEFDKLFRQNIEKSEAKIKDEQKQKSDEFKRMNRWVKESIGALSSEQKKSFVPALKQIVPPPQLYLQSRIKVHEDFVLVRKDPEQRKKFVDSYFRDWLSLQTPEYQKARKNFESSFETWIVRLYEELNSKQKKHLQENLRTRAKQLKTIAERARTS